VSSEQENASRGVKCAPKSVLKNESPPKSRLTRKERKSKMGKNGQSVCTNTMEMKKIMLRGTLAQNVIFPAQMKASIHERKTVMMPKKNWVRKIQTTKKVNTCSYNEQKPGKMTSKMNTSVSSEQENASRVVNGTRKTVLKNEGPPKSRLTRRERIENRKKCTEWVYKRWR
jgi:hypothetical protein